MDGAERVVEVDRRVALIPRRLPMVGWFNLKSGAYVHVRAQLEQLQDTFMS